jgi:HSP20 family protein
MVGLVKWDPFRELELMGRSMRRFGMPLMPVTSLPAADVYETDDEYVVELEVPGYAETELTVEVLDHTLTVKGEHEATTEKDEKTYRLQERLEQQFERRFELPTVADTEKLTATFANGVLELHAPKVETTVPKKIPVTA